MSFSTCRREQALSVPVPTAIDTAVRVVHARSPRRLVFEPRSYLDLESVLHHTLSGYNPAVWVPAVATPLIPQLIVLTALCVLAYQTTHPRAACGVRACFLACVGTFCGIVRFAGDEMTGWTGLVVRWVDEWHRTHGVALRCFASVRGAEARAVSGGDEPQADDLQLQYQQRGEAGRQAGSQAGRHWVHWPPICTEIDGYLSIAVEFQIFSRVSNTMTPFCFEQGPRCCNYQ